MVSLTKTLKETVRKWEEKNLINYNGYVIKGKRSSIIKDMGIAGYDAVRISPSVTTKYGLKYRKVFGAVIEPVYSRGTDRNGRYYPKVTWHLHGYIKAGKMTGTRLIGSDSQWNKTELKRQLMMR